MIFTHFCTFWRHQIHQSTKIRTSKNAKMAEFQLPEYLKLISRNFWVIEKSWNFHTVNEIWMTEKSWHFHNVQLFLYNFKWDQFRPIKSLAPLEHIRSLLDPSLTHLDSHGFLQTPLDLFRPLETHLRPLLDLRSLFRPLLDSFRPLYAPLRLLL